VTALTAVHRRLNAAVELQPGLLLTHNAADLVDIQPAVDDLKTRCPTYVRTALEEAAADNLAGALLARDVLHALIQIVSNDWWESMFHSQPLQELFHT
jgi:hypothetical protein